jgi:ABC-2 type transport system ATP-binding protein
MENAIVVEGVYKQFGKPAESFWQKLSRSKVEGLPSTSERMNDKSEDSVRENGHHVVVAVNHVSFNVKVGEIFGVLGPNGGGKSTLIRLISTLMIPDKGKITVLGFDVVKQPMKVQQLITGFQWRLPFSRS